MPYTDLRAAILTSDPEQFCRDAVFSTDCWLFDNSNEKQLTGSYSDFRSAISETINVSPDDVRLVGSARFGVSLSPKPEKMFRDFGPDSDLDVLIVSMELYEGVWDEFLRAYYNGYKWIKNRHGDQVFRRFITLLSSERYKTEYLRTTSKKMDLMKKRILLNTGLQREIKYRIYASWEAALAYHTYGVTELKRMIENEPQ